MNNRLSGSLVWRGWGTVISFCLLFGSLTGCSPDTPKKIPAPKFDKTKYDPGKVVFDPKADILFVIDDSGSMGDHQNNLAANAKIFVDAMAQNSTLDYHIGVVTTDVPKYKGRLFGSRVTFVSRTTANGLVRLMSKFRPGTNGDSEEKVFDPMVMALSEPNVSEYNKGFLRQDAHLVIMIITDAEDQSENHKAHDTAEFLLSLKGGNRDKVMIYAVEAPTGDDTCSHDSGDPLDIDEFVALMNGSSFSLCDPAFGANLATIGDAINRKVAQWIPLGELPIADTIEVRFGTQTIPNDSRKGWTYDPVHVGLRMGPELILTKQPVGSKIEVFFVPVPKN